MIVNQLIDEVEVILRENRSFLKKNNNKKYKMLLSLKKLPVNLVFKKIFAIVVIRGLNVFCYKNI